ncbi:hypothetical protein NB814_01085 [Latilactobacillus curvatus]|uniref:hypothetical protein n=1 Tax=Latilactobacillus curvatus TaxID=28038 RepID=UPI00202FAF59|nr:hypothetical protein [Latilactobacillus curvatus]MCM0724348.1 hypothetical protein [Latilactobacillus curvatus]
MGFKEMMKAKSFKEYFDAKKDEAHMEEIRNRNMSQVLKNSAEYVAQVSADAKTAQDKKKLDKKTIFCPHCGSLNVEFMQNDRKDFSLGKALAGSAIAGENGAIAGFAGKKGKNQWFCKDCNQIFKKN